MNGRQAEKPALFFVNLTLPTIYVVNLTDIKFFAEGLAAGTAELTAAAGMVYARKRKGE
ncbi:MAG: hypothetical protein IJH62_02965 [Mogibacterium sp.]|nr:hypothetical protein [Mogibacterium sp.]